MNIFAHLYWSFSN